MNDLRIGVVGLNFGVHHVHTLVNLAGARLAAVADTRRDVVQACAARYGVPGYDCAVTMVRREGLDGIVLATPPDSRAAILAEAVKAGVAVFVEKPWALDSSHGRELAKICDGARVMTGFSFRYLPAISRLRQLMAGALGAPLAAWGAYVNDWLPPSSHWMWNGRTAGGYFNENSCHLFDSVNSLLGVPRSLQAQVRSCLGRPGPDMAMVTVRYESGALATLAIGGVGVPAFQRYPRLEVVAENGQALLKGRGHVWCGLEWAAREDAVTNAAPVEPESLGATRYSAALGEFCRCIRTNEPFGSTMEDGMVCVRMAEAVMESAQSAATVAL